MTPRIRITGLVALAALALAAPAGAASETTGCSGLQTALNQAVAGDTITLDQMCSQGNSTGTFTLPSNAAFTLTGQPGSGAGFNGTGVTGAVLFGPSVGGPAAGANFTLSSLTVVGDSSGSSGAVDLRAQSAGGITVQSMHFVDNTELGGLVLYDNFCQASPATTSPFTLSGSTFSGNSATNTTGGAIGGGAMIKAGCDVPTRAVDVTGNLFTHNAASSGTTSGEGALGGGLAVLGGATSLRMVTQSGNTFTGNSATGLFGASTAEYGGGGEWVQAMNLTSTDDGYVGNTATGATGTTNSWTWGAGLGILNSSCAGATHNAAIATNLVVAGNTVTAGTASDVNGAGIYTGACALNTGTDLTLHDSTVSGNGSVAGSVAGIGGGPTDHLTLANTIDTGNSGGADLGGFNGAGGTINASYSDVCASGTALTGTGNICAAPALVSATDVHETAGSPTIDKGSNALVPAGVTTDFFGGPRIRAGSIACRAPFPAAIVDVGAAEYMPAAISCPSPNTIAKATDGNQEITLTTPAVNACTANTKRLAVTVTSSAIPGSKSTKLKFSSAAFYIDKGIKHTSHRRKHKHKLTIIVYVPSATTHHVPATVNLSLAGLKSGTHALKVVLSYRKTTKSKHGHKKTTTVNKTLTVKFSVC